MRRKEDCLTMVLTNFETEPRIGGSPLHVGEHWKSEAVCVTDFMRRYETLVNENEDFI
jgi:hypothetical protein